MPNLVKIYTQIGAPVTKQQHHQTPYAMDSSQLFRAYQHHYALANWLDKDGGIAQSDAEVHWTYCGIAHDFKSEVVAKAMADTFADDEVYLCISAKQSGLMPQAQALAEMAKWLHKKDVGMVDASFAHILSFNQYGTFRRGVIKAFAQSRPRPVATPLQVKLHANMMDEDMSPVADSIRDHLCTIEKALCNDYGGNMEHLWIDLDLVERYKTWPFRLQQRVAQPASYTEPYSYNVGHYSIRPDFEKLRSLVDNPQAICSYVFDLWYQSTQILIDKQKNLDGFNAEAFRLDFWAACNKLGY